MSKKFKAKHMEKLDNRQRNNIYAKDKKRLFIADVGCGIGYFTIPFAPIYVESFSL